MNSARRNSLEKKLADLQGVPGDGPVVPEVVDTVETAGVTGIRKAAQEAASQVQQVGVPAPETTEAVRHAIKGMGAIMENLASHGWPVAALEHAQEKILDTARERLREIDAIIPEEERFASLGYLELKALVANANALAEVPKSDYVKVSGLDEGLWKAYDHLEAICAYTLVDDHESVSGLNDVLRGTGPMPWERAQVDAHLLALQGEFREFGKRFGSDQAGRDIYEAHVNTFMALAEGLPGSVSWIGTSIGVPEETGYLRMQMTPRGDMRFTILPEYKDECLALVKDYKERGIGEERTFDELVQPFTENGILEHMTAVELGALTDDTNIFCMNVTRADNGDLIGHGMVWHQHDYQVNSALSNLLYDGELVLKAAGVVDGFRPTPEWLRP